MEPFSRLLLPHFRNARIQDAILENLLFFSTPDWQQAPFFSGLLAETYLKGAILIFTLMTFILTTSLLPRHRELIYPQNTGKISKLPDSPENLFKKSYKEIAGLLSHSNSEVWISSFLLNGTIGVLIAYYPDYSLDTLTKTQLGGSIASLYVCAMITSLLVG